MTTAGPLLAVQRVDVRGMTRADAEDAADAVLARRDIATRRFLMVADVEQLEALNDVVLRLVGAQNVKGFIVIAAGPARNRDRGVAVRRSPTLAGRSVLTIWVGDSYGVPWTMGAPSGGILPADASTLDDLIAVLSTRSVFDHIAASATTIPYQAVSPGLQVSLGRVDRSILAAALANVVRDMAGGGTGDGQLDVGEDRVLVGDLTEPTNPIRPRTPLDSARNATRAAMRALEESIGRMRGPVAMLTGGAGSASWRALAEARRALAAFVDTVRRTLSTGDVGTPAGRQRLTAEGLDLDTRPGDFEPESVHRRTRKIFDSALASTDLRQLAYLLGDVRDRATPRGAAAYVEPLDEEWRRCETELADPAYPLNPRWLAVGALAALCGLFAGFGPGVLLGLATGAAAVVLWTLLALLLVGRRPGARWTGRAIGTVLVQAAWVLAGAAAGWAAGRALAPPPTVSSVCAVLGLCGLLPVAYWWSTGAVRAWVPRVGLDRMIRTAGVADRQLRTAATLEWALAGPRNDYSNLAGGLAALCRGLAASCDAWIGGQKATTAGNAPETRADGRLYQNIRQDVTDAVLDVVDEMWPRVADDSPGDVRSTAEARFVTVLKAYAQHLAVHGIQQPPPFSRSGTEARDNGAKTAVPASGLLDAARSASAQSLMRQLCRDEDLPLLDPNPDHALVIPFAPRAAQTSLRPADAQTADERRMLWMEDGTAVGILRLVPLGPHAVEVFIPTDGDREGPA